MRTTVDVDDDLAEVLKRRASVDGVSFNRVLNEAIRAGLATRPAQYRMKPSNLGVRPDVNLTKALSLADELGDRHIARELGPRRCQT